MGKLVDLLNERIRINEIRIQIQFDFFFLYGRYLQDYEMEILLGKEGAD